MEPLASTKQTGSLAQAVSMLFSDDLHALIKQLPKLALFLLPIAAIFAFALFVYIQSGEHIRIPEIIRLQTSRERTFLLGKAYSYPDPIYKWESTKQRAPTVLALGTSRVLAFRSKFFTEDVSFFNAGKGVEVAEDFQTFLQEVSVESQPKLIIIGLDQHMFFRGGKTLTQYAADPSLTENFLTHSWRQIYLDLAKRKFDLFDLFRVSADEQPIGLTALVRRDGYRNDGSYQYGDPAKQPFEARKKIIDEVEAAITPDHCEEYGDHINPASVLALEQFLDTARARGIIIVGFVPPYAHALYEKMRRLENSTCAKFIDELPQTLQALFDARNFEFYNFTDITSFGSSDFEMVDATHAGEKAHLRLFLSMIQMGQALHPYTDTDVLMHRLEDAKGDLDVFFHEY